MGVLTTKGFTRNQKGTIAEAAIAHAAVRLGIEVYRPAFEGGRCDPIFALGRHLLRVQCKWATRDRDAVIVRCYSARRTANGVVRRTYARREVDAIAAYCAELDHCYLLPAEVFAGRAQVHLRLARARNNQMERIHWASSFELECLDWRKFLGP